MTSDTTPDGIASASTVYSSSYNAYRAFNGDDTAGWSSASSTSNQWIKYSFEKPVVVKSIEGITIGTATSPTSIIKFKFQASNDGITWTDLSEEITQPSGTRWSGTINLSNNKTAYTNYRIYETDGNTGMVCNKFQLYGYYVNYPSNAPLSLLSLLARSFTKWVKDSYFQSFSPYGEINPNYGGIVDSCANMATIAANGGYSPGFITKCQPGKTYTLDCDVYGIPASETKHVWILYYNDSTYVSQIESVSTSENHRIVFTVPSTGVTDVILYPRRNESGNFYFKINSFEES